MNELSVHAGATETALPADFRWPGGKRLAGFFRCAFEGWSDGHWPGVGPMGNPLKPGVPDLNAIGFAEYGHRRGIFRVLDTLAREDVKAPISSRESWRSAMPRLSAGFRRRDTTSWRIPTPWT